LLSSATLRRLILDERFWMRDSKWFEFIFGLFGLEFLMLDLNWIDWDWDWDWLGFDWKLRFVKG
jgi:hypothetical protein